MDKRARSDALACNKPAGLFFLNLAMKKAGLSLLVPLTIYEETTVISTLLDSTSSRNGDDRSIPRSDIVHPLESLV